MPKKIRDLKSMLGKVGFRWRPGKGSHTVWEHPLADKSVTLSGRDGDDAHRYQEQQVSAQIKIVLERLR